MKVRTLFHPPTVAQGTAPTGGQQNNTSLKEAENHTHHQGFPNTNECTSVNEAQKGQRLMNESCLVCVFLIVFVCEFGGRGAGERGFWEAASGGNVADRGCGLLFNHDTRQL